MSLFTIPEKISSRGGWPGTMVFGYSYITGHFRFYIPCLLESETLYVCRSTGEAIDSLYFLSARPVMSPSGISVSSPEIPIVSIKAACASVKKRQLQMHEISLMFLSKSNMVCIIAAITIHTCLWTTW